MARFGIASGPAGTRRRIATAFAAAGALLLSSGMVIAVAPAALAAPKDDNPGKAVGADNPNKGKGKDNPGGGGNDGPGGGGGGGGGGNAGGGGDRDPKVAICHRRGSDKNPYGIMYVAANSTVLEAHRDHQVDDDGKGEDKYWRSAGVWNGIEHDAGDYKPDFIFGDTGTPSDVAQFEAWCLSKPSSGSSDTGALVVPVFVVNDCDRPGSISEPTSTNVQYTINDGADWSVTQGAHTITASLINGATSFVAGHVGWTVSTDGLSATRTVDLGSPTQCVGVSASAIAIDKCGEWGSVTAVDTAVVDYSIAGNKWTGLQGSAVVTATVINTQYKLPSSVEGWTVATDRMSAQRTFSLGNYRKCVRDDDGLDTLVSPRYPSATDATCSRNGRLVVPNQPKGVRMERTGSVPGTVTFTFSPARGYAFPEGTDRRVSVVVEAQLGGVDCIQGVETVRPNPQPGNGPGAGPGVEPVNAGNDAEVLGEQAVAVPTAVAAGLGDTLTVTSTTGSPQQLAQALVAGGLLMLVAGGATGLGRRTRGAHES